MLLLVTLSTQAQEKKNKNAKHNIEVNGNCEICKKRIIKTAWAMRWNSIGKYFYERKDFKKSFNSYLVGIKLNFLWKGNYIDLIKLICRF